MASTPKKPDPEQSEPRGPRRVEAGWAADDAMVPSNEDDKTLTAAINAAVLADAVVVEPYVIRTPADVIGQTEEGKRWLENEGKAIADASWLARFYMEKACILAVPTCTASVDEAEAAAEAAATAAKVAAEAAEAAATAAKAAADVARAAAAKAIAARATAARPHAIEAVARGWRAIRGEDPDGEDRTKAFYADFYAAVRHYQAAQTERSGDNAEEKLSQDASKLAREAIDAWGARYQDEAPKIDVSALAKAIKAYSGALKVGCKPDGEKGAERLLYEAIKETSIARAMSNDPANEAAPRIKRLAQGLRDWIKRNGPEA